MVTASQRLRSGITQHITQLTSAKQYNKVDWTGSMRPYESKYMYIQGNHKIDPIISRAAYIPVVALRWHESRWRMHVFRRYFFGGKKYIMYILKAVLDGDKAGAMLVREHRLVSTILSSPQIVSLPFSSPHLYLRKKRVGVGGKVANNQHVPYPETGNKLH